MSLYVTDREQPVGSQGGSASHYLVNCVLAETEEERMEHIAFLGGLCYTTDRFPLSLMEPSETLPYAALIPSHTGEGIILDRVNNLPIVSVVRNGRLLRSMLYEHGPEDREIERLAVTYGLGEAPALIHLEEYIRHQSASPFMDRDEYGSRKKGLRRLRFLAVGAIVGALAVGGATALDAVAAMRLKRELKEISAQMEQTEQRKRVLDEELKRPGLPAEEQLRTETVCQALRSIYPTAIVGFEGGSLILRIDHPRTGQFIQGGKMINAFAVSVPLPEISPPSDTASRQRAR